jgi:uncharacterized lipoprotein YddW (UPF0748 family)
MSRLHRRWLTGLATLLLVIALALPGWSRQPFANSPRTEIRGVWLTNIDSDVLFDRARLRNSIRQLQNLNFNTLYPAVWNWGYTLYPSKVAAAEVGAPMMPRQSIELLLNRPLPANEGLAGRDMLRETINQGHRAKMAVIPWFEFGFMAPAASDPAGSQLAQRHPTWLTQKRDGSTTKAEGTHQRVWLNPLHPEVQGFIKKLLVEVVRNYNVDGIQLDDHFGYPSEYGYDSYTVNLYKAEHQGQLPPDNHLDPAWIDWRAGKVTAFMKDLFKAVKAANPRAIISVSPNPQEFSKSMFLADWLAWERAGLVEELVIQLYRNDLSRLVGEMNKPEVKQAQTHIPVAIGILSGLKPRPIKMSQIQEQVKAVRQQRLAGVAFFFYETLWNIRPIDEQAADRQQAFRQLFNRSARRISVHRP